MYRQLADMWDKRIHTDTHSLPAKAYQMMRESLDVHARHHVFYEARKVENTCDDLCLVRIEAYV